jgi:hypothetical protein
MSSLKKAQLQAEVLRRTHPCLRTACNAEKDGHVLTIFQPRYRYEACRIEYREDGSVAYVVDGNSVLKEEFYSLIGRLESESGG